MNSKISLFVLAAGMGSRYGGLKQMEGFGPNGETLIDYSIYDALRAGFDSVVFVIRPDMEEIFKDMFLDRYRNKIEINYVFQSLDMLPDGYALPESRVKPWGTGHALLVAKDVLKNPFLVINGDDFYGRHSFNIASNFLREECNSTNYCLPAYKLVNVLSESGGVKRGICKTDGDQLVEITECFEVQREEDGVLRGVTVGGKNVTLSEHDNVSMNMFGLDISVFKHLETSFEEFLKSNIGSLTGEFLLPEIFSQMIKQDLVKFKILPAKGEWFGITYREDAPFVRESILQLIREGEYPERLDF